MRRELLIALSVVVCTATVAKAGWFGPDDFKVTQADTRFSADQSLVFSGQNNRISRKSIAGGVETDASGVYVDPTVKKDRQTNQVTSIGLAIVNRTSEDTTYGDVNSLGVPQQISFLLDGSTPVTLLVQSGNLKTSGVATYNTIGHYASTDVNEVGIATITRLQYQQIISAKSVAVQIQGSRRSVVYEAKDISPSFIPNLRSFFQQYIQ